MFAILNDMLQYQYTDGSFGYDVNKIHWQSYEDATHQLKSFQTIKNSTEIARAMYNMLVGRNEEISYLKNLLLSKDGSH